MRGKASGAVAQRGGPAPVVVPNAHEGRSPVPGRPNFKELVQLYSSLYTNMSMKACGVDNVRMIFVRICMYIRISACALTNAMVVVRHVRAHALETNSATVSVRLRAII
eukprot:1239507-Pyramimonas_sp.AAC.1